MNTAQEESPTDMGKFSVDKGKRWERELVRVFSDAVPGAPVCRGFQWRDGAEAPYVDSKSSVSPVVQVARVIAIMAAPFSRSCACKIFWNNFKHVVGLFCPPGVNDRVAILMSYGALL